VDAMYDDIVRFMKEYFPSYTEHGQVAGTHRLMDKFYAPDLSFPDDGVTSREQWYERCLNHPAIQDRLTLEHLFVDEKQVEVGALLRTQAVERATGKVLLELKMNVLYNLKMGPDKDLKIAKVRVFVETNAAKIDMLTQLYRIGF
jgi:hypothetical protein